MNSRVRKLFTCTIYGWSQGPVSYTHLDVYKRQTQISSPITIGPVENDHPCCRPHEMRMLMPSAGFCAFCRRFWDSSVTKLMVTKLYCDNFMKQSMWNLKKLSSCKAVIFMDLFIDFVHQFISQNTWTATPLIIIHIGVAIFKHKIPLPYSSLTYYIVSVHFTQFPMNAYWFAVFCLQKSYYWAHFTAHWIFNCSIHFKNY